MFRFVKKKTGGFTLVELIIVILIVGVLSSLVIPLYFGFRKRAMAVEAKTNLIELYKFEINNFTEQDEFTSDLNVLEFDPVSNKYYDYSVVTDGQSFTATASGNIDNDPALDVWTINDKQTVVHQAED